MNTVPTTDKFGFPAVPCSRCAGQGGMDHYSHVDNGVCFQCQGAKVVVVDPKAKAAKAAFLAARVQEATVADLTEGTTFTFGSAKAITRWEKFISVTEDKLNAGCVLVQTTKGRTGCKADFPVRIYVPTDVKPYLEGL
jgi:hypothetical protein